MWFLEMLYSVVGESTDNTGIRNRHIRVISSNKRADLVGRPGTSATTAESTREVVSCRKEAMSF